MLEGKVIMITGAGSGIGKQIAISMSKQRAKIIVSDMNLSLAEETANSINSLGEIAFPVKCDVADIFEVEFSVKKGIDKFNKIDVLVNNAGIFKEANFLEITKELWDMHIDVNLTGAFNCIKTVAPYMIKKCEGSIINIATVDALQGCKGYAPYCASKAGLLGLTKDTALELADYRIRVNAIAPGIIETNMTKERIKENLKSYLDKIPLKRVGRPEDIANAAVYLASNMSDYVTGHTLHVNGGMRFD